MSYLMRAVMNSWRPAEVWDDFSHQHGGIYTLAPQAHNQHPQPWQALAQASRGLLTCGLYSPALTFAGAAGKE